MIKFSDYKIFLKGFCLAILIFITLLYFSARQTTITNNTASWVAHTQEVLFHTERLLMEAINIETGARAFLLTRQVQFLSSFRESGLDVRLELQAIKKLTADNYSQQVRLDSINVIINKRILFSDSIINLEKGITLADALQIVKRGEGKIYTEKIGLLVNHMQQEENRLLKKRQSALQNAITVQQRLFIYSILCMLFLLLYVFWKEKTQSIQKDKVKEEILFRNLLESAQEAMVIVNTHGQIIFINQQAEILFDYQKAQLIGLAVLTLIPEGLNTDAEKPLAELMARRNNGMTFPVEVSIAPIQRVNGKLALVCVRDLSERKRQAERERKSEEFFRLLVTSVKDYAIFMLDASGRVTSWNEGAEHIKGYTEKEILGKSFEIFYSKEDIQKGEPWHNLELAKVHGHFEKEGWRVKKDGSRFWANIVFTALKDGDGTVYGYSKITRDITERKQVQEQLELLSRQVEQSNDAIFTVDAMRKLQSWNKGAENLYGFSKEEVAGKDPNDILQTVITAEQLQIVLHELLTKDYWTGEIKRLTKSGNEIYVRSSTTTVRDSEGSVTGYISSAFDITGQKKLLREVLHLAEIVEQSSEAIFSRGIDKRIISWNRGAEKLFGFSKSEAIGATAQELGYIRLSREEISIIEQETIKNGQWASEMNYYHKDGSSFFGVVTVNLSRHESGSITSFNFIIKDISLRKQMEEQLRQSNEVLEKRVQERTTEINKNEKRFRAMVENNYDIITLIDASFRIIYRSPSVTRIMGFPQNELHALEGIENIHPNDRQYAQSVIQEAISSPGKPIKAVFRRQHNDGHYVWLEGAITNLLHDEQLKAIVTNFRDITEQKFSEDKLVASETRFRLLIENSIDAIALTDAFLNNLYRSPAAQKINGATSTADTIKRIHPVDLAAFKNKQLEALKKPGIPISFQIRFLHATGHYIWLEGTMNNLLNVQGVNAIVSNFRDVTKRKELEDLLHKANTLARIGGWEIDLVKETIYWTDITREIHETSAGYQPNMNTGMNFFKEGKGRDLIIEKVKDAIESGKSWDVELPIITAKNNEKWIRTIGEAEFENGKCIRVYGSFQDIDQRKKAEEKMKKLNIELEERVELRTIQLKKTNEELEAFSYSVSHDLRAPLRAIIGFTSKLENNYSNLLDDEAKRITSVIKSNTLKMGLLIDDLLSFSRLGRQEINKLPIDSNKIVKEIVEGFIADHRDKIQWVIHPLPAVNADHSTIRQVWINLISNAVKYSGKAAWPKVEIGSKNENGMIVFFVRDNGVGFNDKYKAKLFKVFQRLHSGAEFEGTGIGLAIVEKIVSKHGGVVSADGAINEGACFSFSLPV
jgi:PAS domain S-box-containing protein